MHSTEWETNKSHLCLQVRAFCSSPIASGTALWFLGFSPIHSGVITQTAEDRVSKKSIGSLACSLCLYSLSLPLLQRWDKWHPDLPPHCPLSEDRMLTKEELRCGLVSIILRYMEHMQLWKPPDCINEQPWDVARAIYQWQSALKSLCWPELGQLHHVAFWDVVGLALGRWHWLFVPSSWKRRISVCFLTGVCLPFAVWFCSRGVWSASPLSGKD